MSALIQAFKEQKAIMQTKNFYLLPFYFFLLGGLFSCGSLPESSMNAINLKVGVDISKIRDVRPELDTVYLQGKVVKLVPLLERQVYQLQDSTGSIWVLTNQTSLQLEDKVLIKGNIRYRSIPLAGKDFGEVYVEEQKQLERIPPARLSLL
jgi:hypothetical protein